ncbi:uncharacterized protein LOC128216157 [Mya arenaria]|uniref:uncharacterized protein LOC128216157 n=1 Tax=Mya arenaria TaxID=6604 RepID=UPI0022DEDFC3|nr:uncharacterized protein LOC128216157 [Mya arenaria]
MSGKKHWFRKKKRGYSDPELSCNHVNPTVEDEDTVWTVRGSQGESSQRPLCQELVMKETVICGPEMKVRPLPPLPKAKASSYIYDYVDKEFWTDEQINSNERNKYEERLQFFKEMIISNVDVRQVLPHLTFVEYPQKYRNIATDKSKRDAMICLVDEIEKSEELGRWKQFVEALERCGYEYISQCLKGRSVIDYSYQKKFLKIMSVTVRKQIVPTELTAYLWNADVINDEEKQRIECQQTLQGEIAAADLLLEILPTKSENWYKLFIDALRHAEMIDVANILDLPELHEGKTGQKIISTRTNAEYSPANSMQEVTERIQCDPLNVETNPDSDTTTLKSTSPDDVNEQNTNANYENNESSIMDTMEKELYTWSSWASTKSVPDLPFFVIALHSRQKEREMELSISEGDCLKVVEDYGDFYGVQVEGITWLIPKDCAKVFDKVPIPLPRECAESADETYTFCPPLSERNSPSLTERTPVDAFKINDTTDAATYSNDKRYEEVESPHLRGQKIISTRTNAEYSPANSMQEVTERIQCDPLNVETNPDSDTTTLKSTSPDDVNEQNTNANYENKESSIMDTMEKELYTWSSWASTKSVPDLPFFVIALHSRQKEREMELSISEGDCLKVVEDYGDFYGVQVEGITWLIPKDCAKVFDKVPIPLPRKCAESADETYTFCPPLSERNSPSLPERTPVDAFKINDTTDAATYSDDKRYEEVESPHLRARVFDKVRIPLPGECAESANDTYTFSPLLRERAPVDAFKIYDTTDAATDYDDEPYEEVEPPDLQVCANIIYDRTEAAMDCDDEYYDEACSPHPQDTVDEEPPLVNAFTKTADSRENNVTNAKCTSSSSLLKDSSTLDDIIDADWKFLKKEQELLLEAETLANEELEQFKAVVNLKNNINELQCQKLKVAIEFASAGERFKLHRESIIGVQGGNFDHFEPESEYSSEGLYSAQHMFRNRMENKSRDLPLQFENLYRERSNSRKSWLSRASSFKDSAIYECTSLATVEEDT